MRAFGISTVYITLVAGVIAQVWPPEADRKPLAALEEANKEIMRLRAQNQANERMAHSSITGVVGAKEDIINTGKTIISQEAANAAMTQQARVDQAVKMALLDKDLANAKQDNSMNFYKLLAGQVSTVVLLLITSYFGYLKEKKHHEWAMLENTKQSKLFEDNKIAVEDKLHEISAILNHEQEPRVRWLERRS